MSMSHSHAALDRRIGVFAGNAVAVLCTIYAIALGAGLATLPSPGVPIRNPWFTVMELLILGIAPAMVVFTVGLRAWVLVERTLPAQLSVIFMSMCALLTCCVHFAVLTLSRQPAFAAGQWSTLVFGFRWPSLAYALDILAWDVFFPLSALCSALAIQRAGLAGVARGLLFASAVLAFIGLAGIPLANMKVRNLGILGYAVLYPIAAVLLTVVLRREVRPGSA